jgi:signal transduction histidine kinase
VVAKSTTYSIGLALAYGVLASAYILVSSSLAADLSASVEELREIETWKGIAYVVVTTLGVFAGGLFAMRRMDRDAIELLRRERALLASEDKVFAGVMAASVSHDANLVLGAVLADLDGVAGSPRLVGTSQLEQLKTSIGRLLALNQRLQNAAHQGVPRTHHAVDFARLIRDCVAAVRSHSSLRGCRVVCRGDERVQFATQPRLVHQVVSNLVLNAGEATQGRGLIEVVVAAHEREVVVEVHDDGPGVPTERHATLFDSLETTKSNGTGLGLFAARACAQGLGGSLEIDASPLGGALFRLRLPRSDRGH